jgi:FkbM family methyltransferase
VHLTRLAKAALGSARYNRDWLRYFWRRWKSVSDDTLLTFRLRNGRVITLRGSTRAHLNEIFLHRVYDVPGLDLARCRRILDLGANMGLFSIYAASASPSAVIHCFEPASANFAILERNLSANGLRAQAHRLAVSGSPGQRRLSVAGRSGQYSLAGQEGPFETVDCVDLSEALRLMGGGEACDFLKMDIEGEELSILLTTPAESLHRIRAMAMEWHHPADRLMEVTRRLQALGFETTSTVVGHAAEQVMLKAWRRS